jgi:hypothetical protein
VDNLWVFNLGESWSKASQKRKEKENPVSSFALLHKACKGDKTSFNLSSA